jgi:hypothetical protein
MCYRAIFSCPYLRILVLGTGFSWWVCRLRAVLSVNGSQLFIQRASYSDCAICCVQERTLCSVVFAVRLLVVFASESHLSYLGIFGLSTTPGSHISTRQGENQ